MRRGVVAFSVVAGVLLIALGVLVFVLTGARPKGSEEPGGFLGGFFGSRAVSPGRTPNERGEEGEQGAEPARVLFPIHDKAVSGFVVFGQGSSTVARFVERETGNVYALSLETGEKERLTNTTVPAVSEAIFSPQGRAIVFRYLEDNASVRNAVATLPATTTGSFANIFFLENDAYALAFAPNGSDIFYLRKETGGSRGFLVTTEGGNRRAVFSSPLTEWSASFTSDASLYLVQKPGPGAGIAYRVNPKTGSVQTLGVGDGIASLAAGQGLTLASPLEGDDVGAVRRFSDSEGFGSERLVETIPDKCGFGGGVFYCAVPSSDSAPLIGSVADWYLGDLATRDTLFRIASSTLREVGGEALAEHSFDIDRVSVAGNEAFLAFRNKTDGLLWGVRLK